jgi:hypothetical protein
MKKNKNIFSHIIEENYKKKRQEQKQCFEVSGKAFLLSGLQNEKGSLVKQLEKLHDPFVVIEQPRLDDPNQTRQQDSFKSTDSFDNSELNEFSQKKETEVQEPIDQKQDMQIKEQDLRERLLKEIGEKKKLVEVLQLEILTLQNSCKEISQELLSNGLYSK